MNEEQIFSEALKIESATERAQFLQSSCSRDEKLRRRIEALLDSHFQAGEFLKRSPVEAYKPTVIPGLSALAGSDGDLEFLKPSPKDGVLSELGGYEVLSIIGRGGLGVVLKARDPALNRIVAIKVPASEYAANAFARQRFAREAQAAAAVAHDHVVTIHAVGEDGSVPYLVMEFVDGISLQDRIDQSGPLELLEILRLGMQMARGLAAAHAQGLVHRDIKPANILLEDGQRAKLTDFGLARAVDDVRMTRTGMVAGTPQYMSPEQAHGRPVDHRSDLFSLGSVLYAMCAGRPAFRADSAMAVLKRVCDDEQRPACDVNPAIPEWLSDIVDCLLAKEPADRIQTATEVAELLERRLAHVQEPGAFAEHPPIVRPSRSSDASRRALQRGIFITRGVAVARLLYGFLAIFAAFIPLMTDAVPHGVVWLLWGVLSVLDVLAMLVSLKLLNSPNTIAARRTAAMLTLLPLSAIWPLCFPLSVYATYLLYRDDVGRQFRHETRSALRDQILPPVGGGPGRLTVPAGESPHEFVQELRERQASDGGIPVDGEPYRPSGMTGTLTHFTRFYRRGSPGRSLAIGLSLLAIAVAFVIVLKSQRGTLLTAGPPAILTVAEPPSEAVPPEYLSLDTIRTIPTNQARAASLSVLPDGRSALVVSRNESVRLMDLQTGETIKELLAPRTQRRRPDGTAEKIRGVPPPLSGQNNSSNSLVPRQVMSGVPSPEVAVAVSADGKLGAFGGGRDGDMRVWNLQTGEQVATWQLPGAGFPLHPGIASLWFSPDGTELLTTSGLRNALSGGMPTHKIDAVWNIATAKARLVLPVCSVAAWSPDGSTLLAAKSSAMGSELQLGSDELRPLYSSGESEQRHVTALQWLPGNRIAAIAFSANQYDPNASGQPTEVALVDTATRQTLKSFATEPEPVRQLLLLPDGFHLMGCYGNGRADVWNLTTGDAEGQFQFALPGQDIHLSSSHGLLTNAVRQASPGSLVAAGQWTQAATAPRYRTDGSVAVFELPLSWQPRRNPRVVHELKSHTAGIQFLSFAPGGRLVSAARDGRILLWDLEKEAVVQEITPHDGLWSPDMSVSLDDHYATAFGQRESGQRNVRFHQFSDRSAHGIVTQVGSAAPEIQYSAATGEFIVPNERCLDLWRPRSMARHRIVLTDTPEHIAVSGDGTVLLASLAQGRLVRVSIPDHQAVLIAISSGSIDAMAMNSDGSRAVTRNRGSGGAVNVWDVERKQLRGGLTASEVTGLAFAEQDRLIVTGGIDSLRYWDATTMRPYARVQSNAIVLATSADGTLVATGGTGVQDRNCVIRIWELPESDNGPAAIE